MNNALPSDALRWTLEYFISHWNESIPVIMETLEDAGAPQLVLDILQEKTPDQKGWD